jgi:hypothetical protein
MFGPRGVPEEDRRLFPALSMFDKSDASKICEAKKSCKKLFSQLQFSLVHSP